MSAEPVTTLTPTGSTRNEHAIPPPAETVASSLQAIGLAMNDARRRKRVLKGAGFPVNDSAHHGLRDAGLHIEDKFPDETWRRRPLRHHINYAQLVRHFQRPDHGILGRCGENGWSVFAGEERAAEVFEDPTRDSGYRCDGAGCKDKPFCCLHATLVRIHNGQTRFTKFEDLAQPPPREQTPAETQTKTTMGTQPVPEASSEAMPPAVERPQVKGTRKRPTPPQLASISMPGDGLVNIERRADGSVRIERLPAAQTAGILQALLGLSGTKVEVEVQLDPGRLLDVVKAWEPDSLHDRNEILDVLLPGWEQHDENQRQRLQTWVSNQLQKTTFHRGLTSVGLKFYARRHAEDSRRYVYGVKHANA